MPRSSYRWLLPLMPLFALVLALSMYADLLITPVSYAQSNERCFEQTGYCISGSIRDYWEQRGGIELFGLPLSPARLQTIEQNWTGPVQWFERGRLEDHGLAGVLEGRLGAEWLDLRGETVGPPQAGLASLPGCELISETQQVVCEPFLSYWRNNGGADRFGFPLTGPRRETVGDWVGTVQYFERYRMEHHVNADGSDRVLLGRLGSDILSSYGARNRCAAEVLPDLRPGYERVPFRQTLGCPREVFSAVPGSVQPFERGRMLGVRLGEYGNYVFAFSAMPNLFQRTVAAAWAPEQPAPDLSAPADLYPPQQPFATVWQNDSLLRSTVGWGTAPIQNATLTLQRFDMGWLLIDETANTFYAFGNTAADVVAFVRPPLAEVNGQVLLQGDPAPALGGELVVQTQSVDFYRLPGGLTAPEIRRLSAAVEEAIASGSTMMGRGLRGRVALRFEPRQTGPCAIRGLTLSSERTIRMFYEPGFDVQRIQVILAHEFIHQLQHDYYGVPAHLESDVILLEGMAVWASNPYYRDATGQPYYRAQVQQKRSTGTLLPLTTSLEADCRTGTRVSIYDQWGSFTEYLLVTYGRERFDVVYSDSDGGGLLALPIIRARMASRCANWKPNG
ncbi:MAG: hypothetical protein HC914_14465 [Chloroflexaceae bacterium]|nr:hypothetical protein [Chloroflexaceae bacterium]